MQLFIASGNLGADVELRYLPNGDAVGSFRLAINERWTTPSGEKKESTIWVRVSVWRALAENCAKFIGKGSKVIVKGKLTEANAYTKKDGTLAASTEVTADTVDFLDSNPPDEGQPATKQAPKHEPVPESEIPF